jgi:putative transposase
VEYLGDRYRVSERHACKVLLVPRATYRYRSCGDPRAELRLRIRELARARVRYGYRRIRVLLNREGWKVGRYLVYRLYKEEGLTLKKRPARRKGTAAMPRQEKIRATRPNQVWSLDFVSDQLADGRRFRALTVVDIYTRESLAIEAASGLKGADVVRVLNYLKSLRGTPKFLFCDNGSEFTGQAMDLWVHKNQVRIDFSRPGKPTDNAFIESFNATFGSECLSAHWFGSIDEARQLIENWRQEYNESRPHRALAQRTPSEFARQITLSSDAAGLLPAGDSL